jgi:hypothetical protein
MQAAAAAWLSSPNGRPGFCRPRNAAYSQYQDRFVGPLKDAEVVWAIPRQGSASSGEIMSELMAVPLDGGGTVVVEVGDPSSQGGVVKAGRAAAPSAGVALRATQTLESALEPVAAAARVTLTKLRETGPDEVIVEFGLKLTAEVGAVITRTAGECNLKVTLRWERADNDGAG